MIEANLLPCPFCSGQAKLITRGNDYSKKRSAEVECTKCHTKQITGAIRNNTAWCVLTAIKQWNTRNGITEIINN